MYVYYKRNDLNFNSCDILTALSDSESEELSQAAATLYGLIHARYIITSMGLEAMV